MWKREVDVTAQVVLLTIGAAGDWQFWGGGW
jgi:hypothetical protein